MSQLVTDRLREFARKARIPESARVGVCSSFNKGGLVDMENRELVFVANTDDIDCDDEVVMPAGARPDSYFFRNRAVFVDHYYDMDSHVGTMRRADPFPSKAQHHSWRVRVKILSKSGPIGDDILTVANEAGIGCSIGFAALNMRRTKESDPPKVQGAETVIDDWDWMELSVTAMPCNVSCRTADTTYAEDAKSYDAIDRLIAKSRIHRSSARALGFPDRSSVPKRRRIVVLT